MPEMRMNSLKSLAMNCGPLSEMIRGLASGYCSLARSRMISISVSVIDSRKSQCTMERNRDRNHPGTGQRAVPGSQAANHFRQWAAVHRQGFQGVYSNLGDDARENLAVLSPVQRQAGTLASIAEKRMYSTRNASVSGRCSPPDPAVRGSLQPSAAA